MAENYMEKMIKKYSRRTEKGSEKHVQGITVQIPCFCKDCVYYNGRLCARLVVAVPVDPENFCGYAQKNDQPKGEDSN